MPQMGYDIQYHTNLGWENWGFYKERKSYEKTHIMLEREVRNIIYYEKDVSKILIFKDLYAQNTSQRRTILYLIVKEETHDWMKEGF